MLLAPREQRLLSARDLLQEAEVLVRIATLLHLRADYFAKAPILRIPPEIFLMIASFVVDAERPSAARFTQRRHSLFAVDPEYVHDSSTFSTLDEDGSLRPATIGWVKLAHVCTEWRRLCLNAPELWARGIGCLPNMLLEAIQRAGDHVPYDIRVRSNLSELDRDCLSGILASRGRSLDWVVKDPAQDSFVSSILSGRDLPTLTYIRVKTSYHASADAVPAHASFSAPKLTKIDFAFFLVPFVAPSLTYLQLYYVQMSPRMLLDMLHSSPLLKRADISLSWGTKWEDNFEVHTDCPLPNLEALQLSARNLPGALIARALRALVIPSKTIVELACTWHSADDISELWEIARSSFWRESQPWHLILNTTSMRLRMADHVQCAPNATCGGRLQRGHLDFTWQRGPTVEVLLLQAIARPGLTTAFKDVQSIDLYMLRLSPQDWRTVLGQFSSVATMSLESGRDEDVGCDAFFDALAPAATDMITSEPLPKLMRLRISSSCKVSLADVVEVIKRRSTYTQRFPASSVMQRFPTLRLGVLDLRWKASPTLGIPEMQDALSFVNAVTWLDGWMGGPQSASIVVDSTDVRRSTRFSYSVIDGSRTQAFCVSSFNRVCHCAVCRTFAIASDAHN